MWAARHGSAAPPQTALGETSGSVGAGFRRGLLCNVLNPKAAAFFVALMPQFLGGHPATADTLALSVIAVLVTAAWFAILANVVGALRQFFTRQRVRRVIDSVSGAALIGLGLRLATSHN